MVFFSSFYCVVRPFYSEGHPFRMHPFFIHKQHWILLYVCYLQLFWRCNLVQLFWWAFSVTDDNAFLCNAIQCYCCFTSTNGSCCTRMRGICSICTHFFWFPFHRVFFCFSIECFTQKTRTYVATKQHQASCYRWHPLSNHFFLLRMMFCLILKSFKIM